MAEEFLTGGIVVCTSEQHTFGTDAFLLADFANPKRGSLCCDLGTGCGIIPLLWAKKKIPLTGYGIELRPDGIELFASSIARSDLACTLHPLCADLRELPSELPFGRFDLVSCNPPYKKTGAGILSETDADRTARHETSCTLDDVCAAAARLLRFGGRLCICQRPERLADAICAMRAHQIEPKRLRMVARDKASAPWLFLLEGYRGGKPFLQVEKQLCIYEDGVYSKEVAALYE